MSHELRTPLNAIVGFSQVLKQKLFGQVNQKQDEYLDDILSSADHLLALINDILDLSKVEAGQVELETGPVLAARGAGARGGDGQGARDQERRRARARARPGGRPGHRGRAPHPPGACSTCSRTRSSSPRRGEASTSPPAAANGEVLVSVADTGPGIAPEDQARIFEEFQQADSGPSERPEGTGLGLALSKQPGRAARRPHLGRVRSSARARTFTFTLPG